MSKPIYGKRKAPSDDDDDDVHEVAGGRESVTNNSDDVLATLVDPVMSVEMVREIMRVPSDEYRPFAMPFVVDGVDITKPHEMWRDESRIRTPYGRTSAWWLAFHEGAIVDRSGNVVKGLGICNLCGSLLQLGLRSGTSSLTRHLSSKHRSTYDAVAEAIKNDVELEHFFDGPKPKRQYKTKKKRKEDVVERKKRKYSHRIKIDPNPPSSPAGPAIATASDKTKAVLAKYGKNKPRINKSKPATSRKLESTSTANSVAALKSQRKAFAAELAEKCLDAHAMYAADRNRPFEEFDHPSFHSLRQTIAKTALAFARAKSFATAAVTDVSIEKFESSYQANSQAVQNRVKTMAEEIRTKVFEMINKCNAPIVGVLHHWKGKALFCNHDQGCDSIAKEVEVSYTSFAIHWLQDFKRESCVISVKTTDDIMASPRLNWEAQMPKWNLGSEKGKPPSLLLVDSDVIGSNNTKYVECLDLKLQKIADVACKAYLGIEKGLEDKTQDKSSGSEAISLAWRLCHFIDQNQSRRDELQAKKKSMENDQEEESIRIVANVGTQWWSFLDMIDSLLAYRKAISSCINDWDLESEDPTLRALSDVEWRVLVAVREVLAPMARAVKILERNHDVTSSLVPCLLYEIRDQLQNISKQKEGIQDNEDHTLEATEIVPVSVVASQMLKEMDEIIGDFTSDPFGEMISTKDSNLHYGLDQVVIFAHALDPRFKKLKLFDKNVRETIWNGLLAEMVKLRESEEDKKEDDTKNETVASPSNANSRPSFGLYAALEGSDSEEDTEEDNLQDNWKAACEVELSGFKLEKGIKFDVIGEPTPLEWWSERIWRFPTLWKLCQVYFAIPATAMPAERVYREQGNSTTYQRCTLSTTTSTAEDARHCLYENKWVLLGSGERTDPQNDGKPENTITNQTESALFASLSDEQDKKEALDSLISDERKSQTEALHCEILDVNPSNE